MLLTVIWPLILMLVGAAVYILSSNPKLMELGRVLFAAGAFALAFLLGSKTFAI